MRNIICGYNQMPVIRDNPHWEIIEFLDGFGPHEFDYRVLEMRLKRNIISAKEDSKVYHVNQAYDQLESKNNIKKAT